MKSRTRIILTIMKIVAWISFIGFAIQAGSIIISYFVSINNPIAAKNLYNGLDLSAYRSLNFRDYTAIAAYKAGIYILQSYVAYLMIHLLSNLNITKPFTRVVVNLMQKVSVFIIFIWLVVMIHNLHLYFLEERYGLSATYIPGDFIFLAFIVYVFAQMFKRGVQIQSENELTV